MTKLVTKDIKGKIRVIEIWSEWCEEEHAYIIYRHTYQYGGKITIQPDIKITSGKAGRTVSQQATLEINSRINKYKDKGYKELPDEIKIIEASKVAKFVSDNTKDGITDSNGFKKHMLAKQADKVATKVFDKVPYWFGSRKIDGRPYKI